MNRRKISKITVKKLCVTYIKLVFTQKINRLPRSYFWFFQIPFFALFCSAGGFYAMGIDFLHSDNHSMAIFMFVIAVILLCLAFISHLETNIARLHDSGRSAIELFWSCLPYVGWFILMAILGFFKGTQGSNEFGEPFDYENLESLPSNPKLNKGAFDFEEYDISKSGKLIQEDKSNLKNNVIEQRKDSSSKTEDDNSDSDEYWGLISFAYSKIKQTNIFKLWRKEQFDCQFGKCAICNKPMELRFAQVDHIKPRYKKGTNYSDNLALVHKKCNELKGAKSGYERPGWIKSNKYSEKLDGKVYEITKEIRAEYPAKFSDELFERPTHKV